MESQSEPNQNNNNHPNNIITTNNGHDHDQDQDDQPTNSVININDEPTNSIININDEPENSNQSNDTDQESNNPRQGRSTSYRDFPPPPLITPTPRNMFNVLPPAHGYNIYPPILPGYHPQTPPFFTQTPPNYHLYYPSPPPHHQYINNNFPYNPNAQAPCFYQPQINIDHYNSNNNTYSHPVKDQGPITSLLRCLLVLVIVIVVLAFSSSFLMEIIYKPQNPLLRVHAFSVSNFNSSSAASLTSTWDVNMTIRNPNPRLTANFSQGHCYVYSDHFEDILASTYMQPFLMDANTTRALMIRLSANNQAIGEAGVVPESVVSRLDREKKNDGSVYFDLWMVFRIKLTSGSYSTANQISVSCRNLRVAFENNGSSGDGSLMSGDKDCSVTYLE